MKLIIVRHGETVENVKQVIQGQTPGTLSEKGREQARKLALRLKNEKIDVILSSDLQRAKDTAKEIARFHKIPIHYIAELRERDYGPYTGRSRHSFFSTMKETGKTRTTFNPDGVETYHQLKERAGRLLERLSSEYKGKNVLICSHGAFIKMFIGILMKMSIEEAAEKHYDNACINIIEVDDKGHKAHLINSVEHL